jgi:hypothetical protein
MNNEEHIDFEKEVEEFIKFNFIKRIDIISKFEDNCEMIMITLEDNRLHLDCSPTLGI